MPPFIRDLSFSQVLHLFGLTAIAVLTGLSVISVDVGLPILTGVTGLAINTATGTRGGSSGSGVTTK